MEQVLRSALNQVAQAVLIVEPVTFQIRFANRAARSQLRLAELGEIPSMPLADWLTPDSLAAFERAVQAIVGEGVIERPLSLQFADDSRRGDWTLHSIVQGDQRWLVVVGQTESSLLGDSDLPLAPAYIDELTGLPNRRALRQRLATRCDTEETPLVPPLGAVFFVDIDDFKQVNDAYGHVAADRVLARLAQRLAGCVRPADLVSRYGGDEFVLVLELHTPEEAAAVARRIHAAFEQPLEVDGVNHRIPVSIGIALAEPKGSPLDELIVAADRAMYRAKAQTAEGAEGFAFAAPDAS